MPSSLTMSAQQPPAPRPPGYGLTSTTPTELAPGTVPAGAEFAPGIQGQNTSTQGPAWTPPPQQTSGGQAWQPQQAPQQPQGPAMPTTPQQQPQASPQQSIMQQAMQGGPAQTQNFLAALQMAHAGSNNTFQASGQGNAAPPPPAPLLGQMAGGNGNAGSASYAGGFNTGPNAVSYNQGLQSLGGSSTWGGLSPTTSLSGLVAAPPPPGGGSYGMGLPPAATSGPAAGQAGFSVAPGAQLIPPQYTPSTGTSPGLAGNGPAGPQQPPSQQPPLLGGYQVAQGIQATGGPSGPGNYTAQQQTPPTMQMQQGATAANGGGYSQLSDERGKEHVADGGGKVRSFLETIGAHEYSYKDPAHGVGRFVSPMAQELERTELGRSAVVEGADGLKRVEYGRLVGVGLAASSLLHKGQTEHEARIERLERRLGLGAKGRR